LWSPFLCSFELKDKPSWNGIKFAPGHLGAHALCERLWFLWQLLDEWHV